ncbi:ribonuclease P protein component [Patescibacteria group bacterium]|nr:ribonuclease P protein component [Patescibacteria group bacterium]
MSKKATIRNKIRRQLKELIRSRVSEIKKGTDNVFIALSGLENKNSDEIKNTLVDLLKKAKLIKN